MGPVNKLIRYATDSDYRFIVNNEHGFYRHMADEKVLKRLFKIRMGTELDLEHPQTFNEKLQWLKLYDRRPEYTAMVDKYAAKKWVADRIGEEYVIPLLGVWDHFDEIDFDALPEQFVLKCTHDSGGLVIVKDKAAMDKTAAKQKLERCLKRNYYWSGREWPYKNVPPRIIAEKYMVDESGTELKDYKIFNFDGQPKLIQVDYDRFVAHKRNLYSTDWQYIEAAIQYPTDPDHKIDKPKGLDMMLELAHKLSDGYPHVRTDFYNIDGRILFGELTLFHESGFGKFTPPEFDRTVGSWITLPSGGGYLKTDDIVLYIRLEEIQTDLRDYKFYCFNGTPQYCQVICNRTSAETIDFYDMEWKHQDFTGLIEPYKDIPNSPIPVPVPNKFSEMRSAAHKLSEGIPFLRVDFYEVNGEMYFGELTFYPLSGFGKFTPDKWNESLGNRIKLPGGGTC